MPAPVSWQPVLLGGLFKLNGRGSWARTERREEGMAEVERRAAEYGLPPIRWPDGWPSNYLTAMRAATWAQRQGAVRAFAVAATRRGFVHGRDLAVVDEVLAAVQDAALDRDEAAAAIADPAIKLALREATEAAHARGVFGVPTIAVGGELFWGDDRLEEAAAARKIR